MDVLEPLFVILSGAKDLLSLDGRRSR